MKNTFYLILLISASTAHSVIITPGILTGEPIEKATDEVHEIFERIIKWVGFKKQNLPTNPHEENCTAGTESSPVACEPFEPLHITTSEPRATVPISIAN